jgi:hypothetical protein
MNERIKELIKQAADHVNEVYTPPVRSKTPGKIWEDGHIGWHTQFNERLAELIVAETISVLQKRFMGDLNREDMEVRKCIEDVKNHFAVKE